MKRLFDLSVDMKGVKREDVHGTIFRRASRLLGIKLSEFLIKHTGVTPNHLTLIIFLSYFPAAYFYFLNEYRYIIIGALFFLFVVVLDQANGALARMTNKAHNLGNWLDHLSDTFGFNLVFLGITWGLYNKTMDWWIWFFGFLAASAYMYRRLMYQIFRRLFSYSVDVIEKEKSRRYFLKYFVYDGDLVTIIFVLGAFFNQLGYIIIFFGIYGWLFCLALFALLTRRIKQNM